MKPYVKPNIYIEKFLPNVAVSGCTSNKIGESTSFNKQTAYCVYTEQEEVFNQTGGCSNDANIVVYFNGGTYTNPIAAVNAIIDVAQAAGHDISNIPSMENSSQTTVEAGYYVIWINSRGTHAGKLTTVTTDILGFSY